MAELEKVIKGLTQCTSFGEIGLTEDECNDCPYCEGYKAGFCWVQMNRDALELLKEQRNLKVKLLRNIANQQLAVSPTGYETEEGLAKRTGEWNGLQMAFEIVENDGN